MISIGVGMLVCDRPETSAMTFQSLMTQRLRPSLIWIRENSNRGNLIFRQPTIWVSLIQWARHHDIQVVIEAAGWQTMSEARLSLYQTLSTYDCGAIALVDDDHLFPDTYLFNGFETLAHNPDAIVGMTCVSLVGDQNDTRAWLDQCRKDKAVMGGTFICPARDTRVSGALAAAAKATPDLGEDVVFKSACQRAGLKIIQLSDWACHIKDKTQSHYNGGSIIKNLAEAQNEDHNAKQPTDPPTG